MGFIRISVLVLIVLSLTAGLGFGQNTANQIYAKGVEYAVQGEFNEAKEEFAKALKVDLYYEPAKRSLKIIEHAIGQKIKNTTAIHLFKGIDYENKEQWAESIAEFNKALEINPRYANAYNQRGIAYFYIGQYAKAVSDYGMAIEIDSEYADAYKNRGLAFAYKGQHDKAISDYNKAIEINPKYVSAYVNRGVAYGEKQQYDKAIADYTKAIEINPKNAAAYLNRGVDYAQAKGQHDEAISDFTKAIEINPKLVEAYHNRAVSYFYKRDYEKAWDDAHTIKNLGYKVHPGFLNALREASGRQK